LEHLDHPEVQEYFKKMEINSTQALDLVRMLDGDGDGSVDFVEFISGCNRMVVLFGSSYLSRLWCVLELFVFALMVPDTGARFDVLHSSQSTHLLQEHPTPNHSMKQSLKSQGPSNIKIGSLDKKVLDAGSGVSSPCSALDSIKLEVPTESKSQPQIDLKPSNDSIRLEVPTESKSQPQIGPKLCNEQTLSASVRNLRRAVLQFDASRTSCYKQEDKAKILGIIRENYGNLRAFNKVICDMLQKEYGSLGNEAVLNEKGELLGKTETTGMQGNELDIRVDIHS